MATEHVEYVESKPSTSRGKTGPRSGLECDLPNRCPSLGTILQYLFNALPRQSTDKLEAHLFICEHCQTTLEGTRLGVDAFFQMDRD
jgi:hypothetical protein